MLCRCMILADHKTLEPELHPCTLFQVDMALQERQSEADVTQRRLEAALNQSLIDLKAKVEEVDALGAELKVFRKRTLSAKKENE